MAHEYRYPLTRVCLRGGALTLPRTMLGLFPDEGEVVAVDTERDTEYVLEVRGPRSVAGLGELFRAHRLDVNDELLIRRLDDGRYAITPVLRSRVADGGVPEALEVVLDELHEAAVPVTPAEIRALFPDLPEDADVEAALRADGRFAQREGRWQPAARLAQVGARVGADVSTAAANAAEAQEELAAVIAEARAGGQAGGVGAVGGAGTSSEAAGSDDGAARALHGAAGVGGAAGDAATRAGVQAGLWGASGEDAGRGVSHPAGHPAGRSGAASALHGSVTERRVPPATARPSRLGADDEEDDAAFAASERVTRLRAALTPIGFRLEPVGRGVVHLHAEMGRRGYAVLAQVLPSGERLDWAALLARRRSSSMRYLAVFGDHRDLLRLGGPAELARATLWSWEGLERVRALRRTVAISPADLESHFERDGLFEHGLARFEQAVAERVAERGALSEVFVRLAEMRAPTVFLLEELASDAGMPREQTLRILERLADAPFQLVARVDQGEFLLRQRVSDALQGLSDYASSLRERLPSRQRERLTGLGEPDLLTDADAPAEDAQAEQTGAADA